jgi:surface antigen
MKRAFMILASLALLVPALAWAGNDYPYPTENCNAGNPRWGGFYYRNCTDWVAWRLWNNDDIKDFDNYMDGGHWGNAEHWDDNAPTVHYVVNHTPVVGSIAQWNATTGMPVGHVAWVEAVNSDGSVNVAEYNFNTSCGYGTRSNVRADNYIHPYHSDYVSNNGVGWVHPGQILDLQAQFKNDAHEYWINSEDNSDRHNVELVSCNDVGDIVDSWFTQVGWIGGSHQRVTTYDGLAGTKINRTGTATFSFQAQVPTSAGTGNVRVWFRPTHGGLKMDEWGSNGGGLNYYIQVDATQPNPFTVTPNPQTNNVNSFSFSWTASGDGVSGLQGYYWSVNGGAETFTSSLSVPAGAYATTTGNNTFTVRAQDNAGNSYTASAIFNLTSSPCPGREIPHDPNCVPSTTCYPALAANQQTLPDLTPEQWRDVGQPIGASLKPGVQYSIGFEYRTPATTDLKLGLGSANSATQLGLVINNTNLLPSASDEWRTFWSAPFTVTAEQLSSTSFLRFIPPPNSGLQIRNVRVLAY